jgi:hypothetical protein
MGGELGVPSTGARVTGSEDVGFPSGGGESSCLGAGVTRSDETHTSSAPIRNRNVVPAFSSTRYGPCTRDSSLWLRPTSVTSTCKNTSSHSFTYEFFGLTFLSKLSLYLSWAWCRLAPARMRSVLKRSRNFCLAVRGLTSSFRGQACRDKVRGGEDRVRSNAGIAKLI